MACEPAAPLQPRLGRSGREAVVGAEEARLVGRGASGSGRASTRPTSTRRSRPTTCRPTARGAPMRSPGRTRSSCKPTGSAGSTSRRGSRTARCRRTTSRTSRRSTTRSTASARIRAASSTRTWRRTRTTRPGSDLFPYVVTTYRLTEHHTAGGMSRTTPYLSELQPQMFVEVHPGARARARARARRLGDDRRHALGDRGARDGDRSDAAREDRRRQAPPGRPALPLGPARA